MYYYKARELNLEATTVQLQMVTEIQPMELKHTSSQPGMAANPGTEIQIYYDSDSWLVPTSSSDIRTERSVNDKRKRPIRSATRLLGLH